MRITTPAAIAGLTILLGCQPGDRPASTGEHVTPYREGISHFAEQITGDLAREGLTAWLRHFQRSPAFFMASGGRVVFPSNDSADAYVTGLATTVRAVELHWQQLRIDSLTPDLALIGTPFTESLTDTAGHTQRIAGYFTAIAQRHGNDWQLRDAHWSLTPGARSP